MSDHAEQALFDSRDEALLRRALVIARSARTHGNHPFGALIADAGGAVLLESENTVTTDHDVTAHAELRLVSAASRSLQPARLQACTLYTSTEPCAMCAGAIYWAGIGRVVYALPERSLLELTGDDRENPTLDLECRLVFGAGQRRVEVVGPALIEEARGLHEGFWRR